MAALFPPGGAQMTQRNAATGKTRALRRSVRRAPQATSAADEPAAEPAAHPPCYRYYFNVRTHDASALGGTSTAVSWGQGLGACVLNLQEIHKESTLFVFLYAFQEIHRARFRRARV